MTETDQFEEIHALLRAGKPREVLSRLLDKQSGLIKRPFDDDLNHAWYIVGDVHNRLQQLEQAITAFETAIEAWPDDSETCLALGNAHSDLDNSIEAERWFRRGLEICPGSEVLQHNLANALIDQKREKEAAEILLSIATSRSEAGRLARKNLEFVKSKLKRRRQP